MRGIVASGVVALIALATPAQAQTAKFLQTYDDWAAYIGVGTAKKTCFVVSEPTASLPKGVKRGPIFFYISQYPGENVRNEISVKMGYPLQAKPVEVKIGANTFNLFTKNEGAFVEKKEDEHRLVVAMKGAGQMVVSGISTRGTKTTDTYSLKGLSNALGRMVNECP